MIVEKSIRYKVLSGRLRCKPHELILNTLYLIFNVSIKCSYLIPEFNTLYFLLLKIRLHVQIVHDETVNVCLFFKYFCHRFACTVTCFAVDAD